MTLVKFDNPPTPEAFLEEMEKLNIHFPVTTSSEAGDIIVDESGDELLQIDPLGVMPDNVVTAIAAQLIMALNNAAGIRVIAVTAEIEEGEAA